MPNWCSPAARRNNQKTRSKVPPGSTAAPRVAAWRWWSGSRRALKMHRTAGTIMARAREVDDFSLTRPRAPMTSSVRT